MPWWSIILIIVAGILSVIFGLFMFAAGKQNKEYDELEEKENEDDEK